MTPATSTFFSYEHHYNNFNMHFSDNCSRYYDIARVAVYGTAAVHGSNDERCATRIPTVYSCQRTAMERPDEVTDKLARTLVMKELEQNACPSIPESPSNLEMNYKLTQFSHGNREYSPEELLETGNVSNCSRVGNDVNEVTHTIKATCNTFSFDIRHLRDGDGNDVKGNQIVASSKLQAHAELGICDLRNEAMPQAMEDLRNLAAHNMRNRATNAYDVDPKDLECSFVVHPR